MKIGANRARLGMWKEESSKINDVGEEGYHMLSRTSVTLPLLISSSDSASVSISDKTVSIERYSRQNAKMSCNDMYMTEVVDDAK